MEDEFKTLTIHLVKQYKIGNETNQQELWFLSDLCDESTLRDKALFRKCTSNT